MRYIVRLKEKMNETQREALAEYISGFLYESQYLPIIGIEASSLKDVEKIKQLNFVERIRESRQGTYLNGEFLSTIIFSPPVNKRFLSNNNLYGWGDTRIFVLDSGVNVEEVQITESKDFTNTGPKDFKYHGTIVAKIIRHMAKGSNIYSGKIGNIEPEEINLMRALEWSTQKGAKIINISASFNKKKRCNGDCELCELVNYICNLGIAIVVAAGNGDKVENSIWCPALATGALTVGSIDENFRIAEYSSIGKPGFGKPNMVAPGKVFIDGNTFSGTSFSAPLISGILGAILYRIGSISKAIEYIITTTDDLGLPMHHQGMGCLNLERLTEVIVNETIDFKSEGQEKS